MESVSSRIWTRVVVSISYDDNHYTTGTSIKKAVDISSKVNGAFTVLPVKMIVSCGSFSYMPVFDRNYFFRNNDVLVT